MSTVPLGLDAKLYRNTGTYDSPNWVVIGNARDVTLNLTKGEADVTTRANNGWRATRGTLKDASIDFQMVWNPSDAGFAAIRDAFFGNTSIEIMALSGDKDDAESEGLRATCDVFSFTRNEALEDALTVDVSLKPTYATNAPTWIEPEESSSSGE